MTLALFVSGRGAPAQEVKYPEIWGREMPIPEGDTRAPLVRWPAITPDGRVVIAVTSSDVGVDRWAFLYDFFAGEVIHSWRNGHSDTAPDSNSADQFVRNEAFDLLPEVMPIAHFGSPLPDGSRLRKTSHGHDVLGHAIEKVGADGKTIFHWMVVYVADKPQVYEGNSRNDLFEGRSYGRVFSRAVAPKVYVLPDGTFLMIQIDGPLLLRYRDNLDSPYLRESGKVLLVNPEETTRIHRQLVSRAFDLLGSIKDLHPEQPWLPLEFSDVLITEHFKKLIDQRKRNR